MIASMPSSRTFVYLLVAMIIVVCGTAVTEETHSSSTDDLGIWQRFRDWRKQRLESTDTYILAVQGPGYAAIQDTRMTPMVYRAAGAALLFEDRTYRPREIVISSAFFQFSYVLTDGALDGSIRYVNPRGAATIRYMRRLESIPLAIGGAVDLTGNWRILEPMANSALNFDIITSIGPAVRWEREMTLFDRPARWHVGVSAPLVSYVVRVPEYNLSYGTGTSYVAPPWKLYRLRFRAGVDRLLTRSDENRLSLDYRYDFYGLLENPHRLTLGLHTLTIGYALKTK